MIATRTEECVCRRHATTRLQPVPRRPGRHRGKPESCTALGPCEPRRRRRGSSAAPGRPERSVGDLRPWPSRTAGRGDRGDSPSSDELPPLGAKTAHRSPLCRDLTAPGKSPARAQMRPRRGVHHVGCLGRGPAAPELAGHHRAATTGNTSPPTARRSRARARRLPALRKPTRRPAGWAMRADQACIRAFCFSASAIALISGMPRWLRPPRAPRCRGAPAGTAVRASADPTPPAAR
jgi:hypothetical protein